MNAVVFILISIAVAALIGGMTNHLAIKMLFHPRKKIVAAGISIPFTPGLIPKRKDEIARSLGRVVADYLVTTHGLSSLLKKPEFRQKIESQLSGLLAKWAENELTLEQMAVQYGLASSEESFRSGLAGSLQSLGEKALQWFWENKEGSRLQLGAMIPGWSAEMKQRLTEEASEYVMDAVKSYLGSVEGNRMLRTMTGQFLDRSGGLLGTLAGLFMDEDKIIQKLKTALLEGLDSPSMRQSASALIKRGLDRLETMTLAELVEKISALPADEGIKKILADIMQWDKRVEAWGNMRPGELVSRFQNEIGAWIPLAVDVMLRLAEANMERIFAAVELPKLVEEQVHQFPVERLEEIILSVSGKEFRAITWLGALLGGLIGLIQAVMLHWYSGGIQ